METTFYLDLFDDGLYAQEQSLYEQPHVARIMDALRYQILISVLFRRTIMVPEQWLVSSALFREVAFEVLDAWVPRIRERISYGRAPPRIVQPPFQFSFYRRGSTRPAENYVKAFHDRLAAGRRIQQGPALDLAADIHAGDNREHLKQVFAQQMEADREEAFGQYFLERLAKVLGDEAAAQLQVIAQYINRMSRDSARFVDMAAYHRRLKDSLGRLHRLIADPAVVTAKVPSSVIGDRLEILRALFEAARAKQVDISQVTELWAILDQLGLSHGYDRQRRESIECIGRAVMHRALKDQCASELGSLSLGAYRDSVLGDAFEDMVVGLSCGAASGTEASPGGNVDEPREDFEMWLTRGAAEYRMADRLPWPDIWRGVWSYAYSQAWSDQLARLQEAFFAKVEAEKRIEDILPSIFDALTANLGAFVFKYHQGRQPYLELGRNLVRLGEGYSVAEKAGGSVFGKHGGALLTSSADGLSLGLGFVVELAVKGLKTAPAYRSMLTLERQYRSLKEGGGVERLIKNVWSA